MLNQIASLPQRRTHEAEDAVDLLTACHQRIRHFTSVASKLAHAQSATADEIQKAADTVHRYFSVSLPLHEADEDESLSPVLRVAADERVCHALQAMGDQHQAIEELLERLLPLLVMIKGNPGALHEVGSEMCSVTQSLSEIVTAHLQMEEEVIFPAIRSVLAPSAQADLLREMRERRKQGSGNPLTG